MSLIHRDGNDLRVLPESQEEISFYDRNHDIAIEAMTDMFNLLPTLPALLD
jgi:hypothetical protein